MLRFDPVRGQGTESNLNTGDEPVAPLQVDDSADGRVRSFAMTIPVSIAVAMFTVTDQDEAVAFYTDRLGWEVRSDVTWGHGDGAGRWVEVAPPGSTARLALNPPMGGQPGGGSIGVAAADLDAERERLRAAGIEPTNEMPGGGPVPAMFAIHDPDENWIWVVAR